jgi:nitrite reductase/ring-hydroxylating ferredoxin subunit
MKSPVARSADIPEGGRIVLDVSGVTVGLFRASGRVYAYENTCPHQGGPVCQGLLIPGVEEELNADQTFAGFRFDASDPRVVCPWHGYEFSITTGRHPGNPAIRLRHFEVSEEEGVVYVGL